MKPRKTAARGRKFADPLARQLVAAFGAAVPSIDEILDAALRDEYARYGGDVEAMKAVASQLISGVEAAAHARYREAERVSLQEALRTVLTPLAAGLDGPAAIDMVASHAGALDGLFMSISQSRKSRAGASLEVIFDTLFATLGYPFQRHHVVNGIPDFVFPSAAHFKLLPTDCIVFTSKRTLRERWRQITTEGSRGAVLFLGTLDPKVKDNDLAQMTAQKINLVVPESIRAAHYPDAPNVLSVDRFLVDHLDPGLARWRRNGVVK